MFADIGLAGTIASALVTYVKVFFRNLSVNFLSDNAAPVAPAILDAIVGANDGFTTAYGDDDWTRSVERHLSELFKREVAVFLVSTGTAANALALAHLAPPWGAVLCHADSHIATDECGAPEFFGGGIKLVELPGDQGKLTTEALKGFLANNLGHSPHQMVPSALSITQATEAGTVYRLNEIVALCEIAHERSLAVHMDGARFANAVVQLGATPAEATWQSGIDVLSFGATKAGALAAEAVVFFDPTRAAFMAERRKRAGHLLSKHRFLAAQFAAILEDGRWLALARRLTLWPIGSQPSSPP
jgi:threonine aldolase